MEARRAYVAIKYNGKDVNECIRKYMEGSFTYTDVASGSSDTVSLVLNNADNRWINQWKPEEGDKVIIAIVTKNWYKQGEERKLVCGSFGIDKLSYSGRPRQARIGAISTPVSKDFASKEKSKTWKKVTIQQIAKEIAKNAGLHLYYDADQVTLKEIEQDNQTDSSFLYKLCSDYGIAMKAYYNKICIYNLGTYEKKKVVSVIDETEMEPGYELVVSTSKSCTGATMQYTDKNGKTVTATVGKAGKMLKVSGKADSLQDAQLKARAKMKEKNRGHITLTCKIIARQNITAGCNVDITGFEKYDGKYFVDKVVHSVGPGGYKMSLSMHCVELKIDQTRPVPKRQKKEATGETYIIKSGDNLWSIAKRFYKSGPKYKVIYNANKETIENTAKAHGRQNSGNGHWIYPGTKIIIPEE